MSYRLTNKKKKNRCSNRSGVKSYYRCQSDENVPSNRMGWGNKHTRMRTQNKFNRSRVVYNPYYNIHDSIIAAVSTRFIRCQIY